MVKMKKVSLIFLEASFSKFVLYVCISDEFFATSSDSAFPYWSVKKTLSVVNLGTEYETKFLIAKI